MEENESLLEEDIEGCDDIGDDTVQRKQKGHIKLPVPKKKKFDNSNETTAPIKKRKKESEPKKRRAKSASM